MKIEVHNVKKKGKRYEMLISFPGSSPKIFYGEVQQISGIEMINLDELLDEKIRKYASSDTEYYRVLSKIGDIMTGVEVSESKKWIIALQ